MIRAIDELLAPDLIQEIQSRPITELRELRVKCSAVEGDVSLVRRMAQGRLDIVGHEARLRNGGTQEADLSGLLFDLPDVLTDGSSSGGGSRPVEISGPGPAASDLIEQLNGIAAPATLSGVANLDQPTLTDLLTRISDFEIALSTSRRQLHERIDVIQAEVGRRYREGEASVDTVLG